MTGRWFSPGTPVSSTNKTDHHDITEILLKVALNTITHKPIKSNFKMRKTLCKKGVIKQISESDKTNKKQNKTMYASLDIYLW